LRKRQKILWVDTETTNLDPVKGDIWQLAYLIEIDGKIEEEHKLLIKPYNFDTISEEALAVGGTTLEELQKIDLTVMEAVEGLKTVWRRYIDKYDKQDKFIVAGYFVRFDMDFLRSTFLKSGDKYGPGSWCYTALMDISTFVAETMLKTGAWLPNFKLSTVCERFGIDFKAHDALEDVKTTRELYKILREIKEVNS